MVDELRDYVLSQEAEIQLNELERQDFGLKAYRAIDEINRDVRDLIQFKDALAKLYFTENHQNGGVDALDREVKFTRGDYRYGVLYNEQHDIYNPDFNSSIELTLRKFDITPAPVGVRDEQLAFLSVSVMYKKNDQGEIEDIEGDIICYENSELLEDGTAPKKTISEAYKSVPEAFGVLLPFFPKS